MSDWVKRRAVKFINNQNQEISDFANDIENHYSVLLHNAERLIEERNKALNHAANEMEVLNDKIQFLEERLNSASLLREKLQKQITSERIKQRLHAQKNMELRRKIKLLEKEVVTA